MASPCSALDDIVTSLPPETMPASALKHSLTLALFSITLFISAAAMFVLQLMVGKMLLPLTGGTPAGWIVAMAFFQLALLAGYALAFWLSKYPPRVHGFVFLAALAAGASPGSSRLARASSKEARQSPKR